MEVQNLMGKRFYSKRTGRKGQRGDVFISQEKWEYGVPSKENVQDKSLTFQEKGFRDLQNVGMIEVKADPNSIAERSGVPYNVLARTNKVTDANYAGYDNINGNILTRLQNSNDSQLVNNFDTVSMNIRMNYLYLCYKTDGNTNHNNLAVNKEMLKAFNEALSKGYSTMLTQLPFYVNKIESSLPALTGLSAAEKSIYGKFGGIIHYQTVLQNLVAPLAKYIQTMSLEDELQMMSYRREAPLITALYGLLRKKAFVAVMNSIGTNIIGEYFDLNWYKQNNTLINVPSRKSKSMFDPLITATSTTYIPDCKMSIISGETETVYYDSTGNTEGIGGLKAKGIVLNPDTWTFTGTKLNPATFTLEELVYRLNRLLDQQTILTWARKLNVDSSSVGDITTPSAYYQQIVRIIEMINVIATSFVTAMADIRTFIDKLSESHMVYWQKGVKLSVDRVAPAEVTYNVLLHNMVSAYIGGSANMIYDINTQRWQCYTLWNKYEGIAEFDRRSGGSFLTFGLRNLNLGDLSGEDIAMCLPIFLAPELTVGSTKCLATTRKGYLKQITSTITNTIVSNPTLARLDPMNVGFSIKLPTMDVTDVSDPGARARISSTSLMLLQTLAGYGTVKRTATQFETVCDPDNMCFLDVQIEDVSNEMITYCRNYSPFRVQTPDGKRTIGFGK